MGSGTVISLSFGIFGILKISCNSFMEEMGDLESFISGCLLPAELFGDEHGT